MSDVKIEKKRVIMTWLIDGVHIDIEQEAGFYYATSPRLSGLVVSEPTLEALKDHIARAIAEIREAIADEAQKGNVHVNKPDWFDDALDKAVWAACPSIRIWCNKKGEGGYPECNRCPAVEKIDGTNCVAMCRANAQEPVRAALDAFFENVPLANYGPDHPISAVITDGDTLRYLKEVFFD